MPSIVVEPFTTTSNPSGGPVIGGVSFRFPTTRSKAYQPVASEQELANGSTRAYWKGKRLVVSLAFAKMTEDEVAALVAALDAPFVTYADDATAAPVVMAATSDDLSVDPIGGTWPLRSSVTLTLKSRDLVS